VVVPGLHVAAWVVITLIALRIIQLVLVGRSDQLSTLISNGITFAIGH
jgi:hypothetical protein